MRPRRLRPRVRPLGLLLLGLLGALVPAPAGAQPREGTTAPARESRVHTIRSGDTLSAIARTHGVSVAALVSANRLASDRAVLRPGQRLVIPAAAAARSTRGTPAPPRAARPREPRAPGNLVLEVPDWADHPPGFVWPLEGPVTSTFGLRRTGWHRGVDIKADRGTPIVAASSGTVVVSAVEPRYGRVVKIEHDDGFVTVYAHNDRNLVKAGARVEVGEPIATVGRTGRATTHHVHFEIRRDGRAYNPLYLLPLPPRIAQVDETDENPPE